MQTLNNNAALCESLRERGMIKTDAVAKAFASVDRGEFVPACIKDDAYEDLPVRDMNGPTHLSAPHIYAVAAEELEFQPGLSFLCIGSGTGYFTNIVGELVGPRGLCHGLELSRPLVQQAQKRQKIINARNEQAENGPTRCRPEFFLGNFFDLDMRRNMSYDRIYVAASAPRKFIALLCNMLNSGGVMVGPFGDSEFLKVRVAAHLEPQVEVISNVSFAPLLWPKEGPATLVLRCKQWRANADAGFLRHAFPRQFRVAIGSCLMLQARCSGSPSLLPLGIWHKVFTFMSRDWFQPQLTEVQILTLQLQEEISRRKAAEARAERLHLERNAILIMLQATRARLGERGAIRLGGSDDDDSGDEKA